MHQIHDRLLWYNYLLFQNQQINLPLNLTSYISYLVMHLQDLHLSGILPVTATITISEDKLAHNFRILADNIKSQEAIRTRFDALTNQQIKTAEDLAGTKTRLEELEKIVDDKLERQMQSVLSQSEAIRIEFETMKPYLQKIKTSTERVDGLEKRVKEFGATIKEVDMIRKQTQASSTKVNLLVENLQQTLGKKIEDQQDELEKANNSIQGFMKHIIQLRNKIESVETTFLLAPKGTGRPPQTYSTDSVSVSHPTAQSHSNQGGYDDLFKQRVLEKISTLNAKLSDFGMQSDILDLQTKIKDIRKKLDDKMDIDQYGRILDFMNKEIQNSFAYYNSSDKRDPTDQRPSPVIGGRMGTNSVQQTAEDSKVETKISEPNKQIENPNSLTERKAKELDGKQNEQTKSKPDINLQSKSENNLARDSSQDAQRIPDTVANTPRRRGLSRARGGVEDIKTMQTLKSKMQNLQQEIQALKKQVQTPSQTFGVSNSAVSQNGAVEPVLNPLMRKEDVSLPNIRKERRINSIDYPIDIGGEPFPQKKQILIKEASFDKALMHKEIDKKMAELRSEVHYYFKQMEKLVNGKESKDDFKKRMDELMDKFEENKQLISKKADAQTMKKNLVFLENKLNQVISIMIVKEGEDEAVSAKRGWTCLSCDKNLGVFQGKQGDHKNWNQITGNQSPPKVNGFAPLAKDRYKGLALSTDPEKDIYNVASKMI